MFLDSAADPTETERRTRLIAAEARALALLDRIEALGLVQPGLGERAVEKAIRDLAAREFGVERDWHKRIVRAGANTLSVAHENPPERVIGEDDLVFLDIGPVFADEGGEFEADVGRSYAIGMDPAKQALVAELPRQFDAVCAHLAAHPDQSGADLYAFAGESADRAGWDFGGVIAGHIVGEFAHVHWQGEKERNRISAHNPVPMSAPDPLGRPRHWIVEIHLVDREHGYGGFYERLAQGVAIPF